MKWLRAFGTDALALPHVVADLVLGPKCQVTRERVYPRDRHWHERYEHPTDGSCDQ